MTTSAGGSRCVAIVPYREQPGAKSRLAAALTPEQRVALARAMLSDVLLALMASKNLDSVLLVGDATPPAGFANQPSVRHLPTPLGLNESVKLAAREGRSSGADELLIVHGDLPLLVAEQVDRLIQAGRALPGLKRAALVSCQHHDGTNVLWLSPARDIEFQYGAGSRARHLSMLEKAGYACIELPPIADVDQTADLEVVRAQLPAGSATARLLRSVTVL